MKNIHKTSLFTFVLSAGTVILAIFIQLRGQSELTIRCSYLDPIEVDVLAFAAALFLVIEGLYKIAQNKNVAWTQQITRSVRIAFGLSILTLHIIQVVYK